jgi:hypothetical protein
MRPMQGPLNDCAPGFDGPVVFSITVTGPNGQVVNVQIVSNDPADEVARQCMEGVVRGANFPRFVRDELTFSYPFEL